MALVAAADAARRHRQKTYAQTLGKGGFGKVLRIHDRRRDFDLARKCFNEDQQDLRDAELAILKVVKHNNIIRQVGSGQVQANDKSYNNKQVVGSWFIDLELVSGWPMDDLLEDLYNRKTAINGLAVLSRIVRSLLDALRYLHDICKIIHNDIKPPNIMVRSDSTREPVLIDFGMACYTNRDEEKRCNTGFTIGKVANNYKVVHVDKRLFHASQNAGYQPPESLEEGNQYATSAYDIWALGASLYHLVFGIPAVEVDTKAKRLLSKTHDVSASAPNDERAAVRDAWRRYKEYMQDRTAKVQLPPREYVGHGRFEFDVPTDIYAIILLMMQPKPKGRPTAAELLRSEVFRNIHRGEFKELQNRRRQALEEAHEAKEELAKFEKKYGELECRFNLLKANVKHQNVANKMEKDNLGSAATNQPICIDSDNDDDESAMKRNNPCEEEAQGNRNEKAVSEENRALRTELEKVKRQRNNYYELLVFQTQDDCNEFEKKEIEFTRQVNDFKQEIERSRSECDAATKRIQELEAKRAEEEELRKRDADELASARVEIAVLEQEMEQTEKRLADAFKEKIERSRFECDAATKRIQELEAKRAEEEELRKRDADELASAKREIASLQREMDRKEKRVTESVQLHAGVFELVEQLRGLRVQLEQQLSPAAACVAAAAPAPAASAVQAPTPKDAAIRTFISGFDALMPGQIFSSGYGDDNPGPSNNVDFDTLAELAAVDPNPLVEVAYAVPKNVAPRPAAQPVIKKPRLEVPSVFEYLTDELCQAIEEHVDDGPLLLLEKDWYEKKPFAYQTLNWAVGIFVCNSDDDLCDPPAFVGKVRLEKRPRNGLDKSTAYEIWLAQVLELYSDLWISTKKNPKPILWTSCTKRSVDGISRIRNSMIANGTWLAKAKAKAKKH